MPSHHVVSGSTWSPNGITGDVHLVKFLCYKVTVFLFPYSIFWKQITKSSLRSEKGWPNSTPWREAYIHPLKFFCKENLSPTIIYLLNHLFILVRTYVYSFYTLGHNPILHDLYSCSNCSSFGHQEFFQVHSSVHKTCAHACLLACLLFS